MCATFILSLYIVYEFNTWLPNPANSFALKNCLFDTVKLTRNANKSKLTYNSGRITFDGEGFWSFGNDSTRNVVIFGIDNSLSSHVDNRKNNFLGSGEGSTQGINDGTAEKKLVLTLVKQIQNFA